jgi:hypothetical protein
MFQRPRGQTKRLPITLHFRLNTYHGPSRLQSADTHPPLHVSSEHLIFQASDRLLERLALTLQPSIPIDLGPERPIAYLTDGLVDVVVPHIVSIKKPKYFGGNGRGRNINVDDGCGVNLTMVGGAVNREMPLYKGVRSVEMGPDVTRRRFTAGVSSNTEGDERRSLVMLKARWSRRCGSASALA